jgi:hypothetical protein
MCMVTDCALRDQRIDACDTDLTGTWETPKGQRRGDVEEENGLHDHLDVVRQCYVDGWDCCSVGVDVIKG